MIMMRKILKMKKYKSLKREWEHDKFIYPVKKWFKMYGDEYLKKIDGFTAKRTKY